MAISVFFLLSSTKQRQRERLQRNDILNKQYTIDTVALYVCCVLVYSLQNNKFFLERGWQKGNQDSVSPKTKQKTEDKIGISRFTKTMAFLT